MCVLCAKWVFILSIAVLVWLSLSLSSVSQKISWWWKTWQSLSLSWSDLLQQSAFTATSSALLACISWCQVILHVLNQSKTISQAILITSFHYDDVALFILNLFILSAWKLSLRMSNFSFCCEIFQSFNWVEVEFHE